MNQDDNLFREIEAIEQETRWQAVQAKDARFNGLFVYGVRSTGIYCRPSCPSRRPRREQVEFFLSCEAAEKGGFRECLRCRPRRAVARDPKAEMVLRACRAIEARGEAGISLDALSEELAVSPHHLHRVFKKITGVTPRQYSAAFRLEGFKSRIRNGEDVTRAIYESGYGSSSRLYEKSSEHLGMTPATYRRGGKGMSICYTIVDSRLGRLLVAATPRGICAVSLGEQDRDLEARLAAEYPAADIRRDDTELFDRVNLLLDHLEGERPHLDLPLDLQATAFQMRVWEELRNIPYGETRTYGEVAEAIGRPGAVRAVARACATNPVAIVTPCHRVIRGDGSLGGYRWGMARKEALLSRERKRAGLKDEQHLLFKD